MQAIRYRADFTYRRERHYAPGTIRAEDMKGELWPMIVEDVKSRATRTKEYILKRKLMKERFDIDIREV